MIGRALPPRSAPDYTAILLTAYVTLLPVQVEIATDLRLAPSDGCLLLYAVLAGRGVRHVSAAWSFWHAALAAIFCIGIWTSTVERGELTRYVLLNKAAGLLVLFLCYACFTSHVRDWSRMRNLLRWLVLSVVVTNCVAIVAFFAARAYHIDVPGMNSGGGWRLSGMLVDANGYGGLLVFALAINEVASASEFAVTTGWLRAFSTVTLLGGILLTFSRSAWLSLALVLVLAFCFSRRSAMRIIGTAAVVAPLILIGAGGDFLAFAEKMAKRPKQAEERLTILYSAFHYFPDKPVFGIGLGTFIDREPTNIHNTGVWFLTEFGLAGFTVYAGLAIWYVLIGRKALAAAPANARPLILALLFTHAGMLGLSFGIEAFYKREWWVALALIGSAYAMTRRQDRLAALTPAAMGA